MNGRLPASTLRYERKWKPTGLSVAEVLSVVRHHPAAFRTTFPERQVNNLYFDTPALDHYHAHIDGVSERMKARLRWYGDFDDPHPRTVLELKCKRGAISWKETYRIQDEGARINPMSLQLGWETFDLPEATRHRLRHLQPTLANYYHRYYFVSALHGIRLTVDYRLGFRGFTGLETQSHLIECHQPSVIVELKYPEIHAEEACAMGNEFPFRLGRCSKYVLGIQHAFLGIAQTDGAKHIKLPPREIAPPGAVPPVIAMSHPASGANYSDAPRLGGH